MDIIKRPLGLFWEWIHYAWQRQRLKEDLLTEEYLALLLERFLREDQSTILDQPLLQKLYLHSHQSRPEDFVQIRLVGDASLFIAGILARRLMRSSVGIVHYIKTAEAAYHILLLRIDDKRSPLSLTYRRFSKDLRPFVRVLSEISREHLFRVSLEDILTVWDRYLATNDEKDRQWLLDRGVWLLPPGEKKLII